jgi:hypothetical protein
LMTVQVSPITDADLPTVGVLLHQYLNARHSAEEWTRSIAAPWPVDAPNHGFLLKDIDTVVGAYVAFYSQRHINGRPERFCNLGAWCVRPEYRHHGLRLLTALLAQDGYHFSDLSPMGSVVVPLNQRLRFQFLDTTTAMLPNLPWFGSGTVVCDPARVQRLLRGDELRLYQDHVRARGAHHVVLVRDAQSCYVVYRIERYKGLPLFASVLYISDADLFRRTVGRFTGHLLLRHGLLGTLAELRVVGHRPRASVLLRRPLHTRMFRSVHLRPDQIDYLYSELVCVPG